MISQLRLISPVTVWTKTIEDSSQPLRSDVDRLYTRIAGFDVRMTTLEQSLDGASLVQLVVRIELMLLLSTLTHCSLGHLVLCCLLQLIALLLRTPGILPCPVPGILSETPASSVQLPVQNLQSYFNIPVSTVTVAQNNNNVQSNYDIFFIPVVVLS